eukprot:gene12090-5583_t
MTSNETEQIIDEVLAVYACNNDIKRIQEIEYIKNEMYEHCVAQQKELKKIVTDLTQQNKKKMKDTTRTEPLEEHEKRLHMLKRELNEVQFELTSKEKISNDMTKKLTSLKCKVEQMEKEMNQDIENFKKKVVPTAKKMNHLAEGLLQVQWDFTNPNVRGYVLKEENVKVFNFDSNKSEFEICNSLWEML